MLSLKLQLCFQNQYFGPQLWFFLFFFFVPYVFYGVTDECFNEHVLIKSINIFDLLGRNIVTNNVESMSGTINLNLESGFYVVQIISEKSIINKKLIVK